MPPDDSDDDHRVTLGEVSRQVDRLELAITRLTESMTGYPGWRDVDRALDALRVELHGVNTASAAEHRPMMERLAALESASIEHERAARSQRGSTTTAFVSAGLSILVALGTVWLGGGGR